MLNFWQKAAIFTLLLLTISVVFQPIASAQWITSEAVSIPSTFKLILDRVWQWLQIALLTGWKNGLNYFLAKWAKDEATRLASSGKGQQTNFAKHPGQSLNESLSAAYGDVLNDLAKGTLGIDLCSLGDPNFAATLFITINQGTVPPPPSCTWAKIKAEAARFKDKLDKNKKFSDWAKINLEVQYAASGGIGLEDDKAVDAGCKQFDGPTACGDAHGTSLKKDCIWYGNQCRSKKQAENLFCKYADDGLSALANKDNCTVAQKKNGLFRADELELFKDVNCKWSAEYGSAVRKEIAASTTVAQSQAGIKALNAGSCIPDINVFEAFGQQFSASGGGSDIDAAIKTSNKAVQKGAKSVFDAIKDFEFGGQTSGKKGLISLDSLTPREPSQAQTQMLQQGMVNNMMSDSGSAIVNAANIFLGTYIQKWLQNQLNKSPDPEDNDPSNIGNPQVQAGGGGESRLRRVQETVEKWEKPKMLNSLQENLSQYLMKCTEGQAGATSIGEYNCTITSDLALALDQGISLRKAVAPGGPLAGLEDQPFGGDFVFNPQSPSLSLRNIMILRSLQVVPVGWEIAALYAKNFAANNMPLANFPGATLRYLALGTPPGQAASSYDKGCFEDPKHPDDPTLPVGCRNNDGKNPWWHLVDPDWVLKLPPTKCAFGGSGAEVLTVMDVCSQDNVPGTTVGGVPTNAPTCDEVEGVVNPDFKVSVVSRNDQYCADRQDCLKIDSHGKCVAYGYCYEQKPVWRFGGDSCSEQAASCANLTRTADGKSFSYLTNTLRSCSKPGCTWLATSQLPSAAWLVGADNPKIFLTLNGTKGVERCSRSGVGCTRLISQEAGINVVVDGDFTQSDWGSYWQAVSNEPCSFANHFSVENQQIEGLEVNGPNSYCTVKTKGQIPIVPNGIYLARLFIQASADAQAQVDFKKADGSVLRTINMNVSAGQVNQVTSTIIFTVDNPDGAPILLQPEISVKANNATATIQAFELVKVDTQTTEFIDNTYSSDYREATDFDAYYKVAADNLDCNRYNDILYNYNTEAACAAANKVWRADWQSCVAGGSDQCLNYLPFCKASDLGCLGYKSVSGGPEVPAKVSQNDFCPNSCVGLALFQRKTTVFEQQEDQSHSAIYPVGASFIPQTAQMCQPRAAGCEEFTNLDQVAAGGEGREYYTFLRQCVQPDNQRVRYYYTWEGSDTAGFQLKRWRLLATSHDDSPCTDIRPGEIYCSGPENPASSTGACTVDDLANPNPNPDCRDFFDLANNHYYRLQTRIVTASADCHPYRRTISNQTYNAIPSEGVRCQVNENGCREYLGNQGNSIRTIFNEDFEDPAKVPANWGPGNSVVISNIAVQPGGHSVLVGGSYVEIKIPSSSLQLGRRYIMTSWAKLVDNGGREAPRNLSASLDFTLYNLTTDWQLYRSDVVTSTLSDYAQVRIYINSLPDGKRALLDNVVLQELPDNFYVIENSWVTPAECTPNYENCRQYQVSSGELVALTGFSRICSAQSKGCQAFIDTRNSKLQSSATYSQGEGVNDITIPNDRLLYLVLQSNKACSANEKACQAFGLPQVNLANPLVGTTNVDTVYFKNDPDKYNQGSSPILCTNQELFCSAFSGKAYFDPAPKQATSSSFKVCSWQNDKWQKLDGSGECPTASMSPNNVAVNPNNENYLLSPDQPGFSGWAASCSPSDNLCKEYRDPEQPNSDRLPLCRSDIGSNTYGICSLAANSNNGEWCFKDSQRVCWVNTGSHDCTYNNLWYCAGAGAENGDCHLNWYGQDIVPCQYTGLANNERWCQFDVSCRSYYQKSVNTDCSNPGVVDRGQGCRLFNDTSDPSLIYNATSSLDGFAPVTVSDTGLPAQANKLVKVEPDRQCSEGLYCKSSISLDKGGKTSQICLSLGACKKFNDKGECAETVVHTADSMNIDLNSPLGSASALPWSKVTRFQTGYKYPNVAWSNTQKIVGNYLPDLMTQTAKGKIGQQFENNSFEKTNTSTVTVVTNNGDAAYTRDHGWVYVVVNPFGDVDQPSSCAFTKERISEVNPSDKALPLMLASNYAVKIELTSNTSSDCRLAQNLDNISNKTGYTITFWAKAGSSGLIMKSGVGFNDGQGLREDIAFVATSWILTKDWQKYTLVIPAAKVPVRTRALRLVVQTPWLVKGAGTVWVDEILIQPSLRVGQDLVEGAPGAANNGEAYKAADCRLFPLNDSATCDYKNGGKNYEGLPGYCLEKDPVNDLCLKWYPITYVTGSHYSASMIDDKINGYSDRLPLYYCLQSDNLLGRQTIVVVNSHDETIIEAGNARKNLIFSSRPFWISAKWAPGDNDYVATHFAGQRTEANAAYEATHCNDDGQHAGCNTNWNYLAFDMNQNNQFDDSDRMANQLWAVAQNSDAELNIADIDKITFRLDWKSDNNWPTAVGTILTTITSDQLYADKNSPNYPQMFRIAGDEGLFSGMWIGIKFLWNNQGQLVGYRASGLANRQNDAIAFSPIFYLKNRCTVIAQVVDSTGDNKVYLNRFNSGDWLSNQGNRAGVNKELTDASQYFGATTVQVAAPFGSFMAPENSLPDQWQNRSSLPLVNYYGGRYDYNKFAGFPLSVARIDNDNARRRCFGGTKDGDFCNTNTNCLGGGVCMGIGKFCYVDRPNGGDLTNGQACESTADCTAPFDDGCALLSSLPTGENGIGQAIANLQGLFAKIYGVWRWTGNSYQSFNPGVALDAAAANGTLPVLEKITISPNQIQAHGGLAKLSFGTVVDVNQVPIRSLTINWGDTQSDTLTWLNSRSDFSLNHSYTCLMSPNGHSCSGCPGGTLIENRQCRYNITVSVVDNWELPNQNQAAGSVLVGY